MRLTQIQQILEIEKCTSISQAARNLYISQPALSKVGGHATKFLFYKNVDTVQFLHHLNKIFLSFVA